MKYQIKILATESYNCLIGNHDKNVFTITDSISNNDLTLNWYLNMEQNSIIIGNVH